MSLGEHLHAFLLGIYLGIEFSGAEGVHMHMFSLASVDAAKQFSKMIIPRLAKLFIEELSRFKLKVSFTCSPSSQGEHICNALLRLPRL